METSQHPDLPDDSAGRMKHTKPPPAVVNRATTRVGRGRSSRPDSDRDADSARDPDSAGAIEDDDLDDAGLVTPRDRRAGAARSTALADIARQTFASAGDRLVADAREACRREGVAASRRELLMRVSKRVGVSPSQAAKGLSGALRHAGASKASTRPGPRHLRDRVAHLAATILGAREREVFQARRAARPDDMAALHELASSLGLSVERVYELEASARRKLATALG